MVLQTVVIPKKTVFTRGDVALISKNALATTFKDSEQMLMETLRENGAISKRPISPEIVRFTLVRYKGENHVVNMRNGMFPEIAGFAVLFDKPSGEIYLSSDDFSFPNSNSPGCVLIFGTPVDCPRIEPYTEKCIAFVADEKDVSCTSEKISETYPSLYRTTFKMNGKTFTLDSPVSNYVENQVGVTSDGINWYDFENKRYYNLHDLLNFFGVKRSYSLVREGEKNILIFTE